jgi:hypothetical protein
MTNPGEPSTPSGSAATTTKATDHELPKYNIFTRYGQGLGRDSLGGGLSHSGAANGAGVFDLALFFGLQ